MLCGEKKRRHNWVRYKGKDCGAEDSEEKDLRK